MKKNKLDIITDRLVKAFLKNKLIAPLPIKYTKRLNEAQKVRKLIANDFIEVFSDCDFILTPTAPSAAFPLNEKQDDPIKMYLNDVFTVPASLAGIPGISIPYGNDKNGLPLGIQLLGKHYNEQEILNAAFALEKDYE